MKINIVAICVAAIALAAVVSSGRISPDQRREKARKMASATLAELYSLQPASRGSHPEIGRIRGLRQ